MKILWFSNGVLSNDTSISTTGTWLLSMAKGLLKNEQIELFNISASHNVKTITRCDYGRIIQWIFPVSNAFWGRPQRMINEVNDIIDFISPDLIHIWGLENDIGIKMIKNGLRYRHLLEIQGISSACAYYYYGGLKFKDIISCIRLKEFLCFSASIIAHKISATKKAKCDQYLIGHIDNISTQSDWVRAIIMDKVSKNAMVFHSRIAIREAFLDSTPWKIPQTPIINIFVMSAASHPFKGLHIAIKAFSLVARCYSNAKLLIAGDLGINKPVYKKPGYVKFLESLIVELNLSDKITFLGPLNGKEIVNEMQKCRVMIHPSFVESYSLTLAEAMAVGIPNVVSFAGAMPELASDETSALFYNSHDYYKCAYQIIRLINSDELSLKISTKSRSIALKRNTVDNAATRQYDIYKMIIK